MRLILPFFIFLQILAGFLASACFFNISVYPDGVWGLSVLGYAIFVILMFHFAKTNDARLPPSSWRLHYIAAAIHVQQIILVATLQLYIFFTIARILFLILFPLAVFMDCLLTHRMLAQDGVSWNQRSTIYVGCYLRIVLWLASTTIYFIRLNEGTISEIALYFVALASYTNCLHFVANSYGILRDTTCSASNGSLFERFKAFIASCFERFDNDLIRSLIDLFLVLLIPIYAILFEFYLRISENYWLISHAVFAILCFALTRFVDQYDPRKPPEADFLLVRKRRWQSFLITLLFVSAISWIRMRILETSLELKIGVAFLSNAIIIFRFVSMIALQKVEVPDLVYTSGETKMEKYVEVLLMVVACAITVINLVPRMRDVEIHFFTIMRSFLFLSTMQSIHIISGRYREQVRPEHFVQVVVAVVPPAVIDPHPEDQPEYLPFRRSIRCEEAISV